jgi:hypothetical protein
MVRNTGDSGCPTRARTARGLSSFIRGKSLPTRDGFSVAVRA